MRDGLSMSSRVDVTRRYARGYAGAGKGEKGRLLDEVTAVTGWSRDNARRRLAGAARPGPRAVRKLRKPRPAKYSADARAVLKRVWAASGGLCGKYLAAAMGGLLTALEHHDELVCGQRGYSDAVRAELLAMSPATIDRYLTEARRAGQLRGKSTTKPSPLLRTSIKIRKAGDEVENEPGFFEADTVAHCGPTLVGEFARSVNFTDVLIGWVFTRSVRNNAHVHIRQVMDALINETPYCVVGLDFDNGSEFLNYPMIDWAAERKIFFTRGRPYKKNDQATIESKNNHLVRRYAFYYRYDTPDELTVLNKLWALANDRLNFFTPTKKPIGWGQDQAGRRKRIYDQPRTPFDRLCACGILSPAQQTDLTAYRDSLNPLELARRIAELQGRLIDLAKDKTDRMRDKLERKHPDTDTGIKIRDVG
jgi:hypothetical protein